MEVYEHHPLYLQIILSNQDQISIPSSIFTSSRRSRCSSWKTLEIWKLVSFFFTKHEHNFIIHLKIDMTLVSQGNHWLNQLINRFLANCQLKLHRKVGRGKHVAAAAIDKINFLITKYKYGAASTCSGEQTVMMLSPSCWLPIDE